MAARNISTGSVTNSTAPSSAGITPTLRVASFNVTTPTPTTPTTPLISVVTGTTVLPTATTFTTTLLPGSSLCPDLRTDVTSSNNNNSSTIISNKSAVTTLNNPKNVLLSTTDRKTWTVVKAECVKAAASQNIVYLQCQGDGQWNSTLPDCSADYLDVSSFKLYFAVAGGVCGLAISVLLILCCYCMRSSRNKSSSSETSKESEENIYVDPYYVSDAIAKTLSSKHSANSDITYAKPVVYTTYLNPSYYEDAYDRWRKQEQNVSERLYDSPWTKPRGLQSQMETPDFKWSHTSLKTIGESGFRKLPRVQLPTDHGSIKSNDTIGPSSTTYSRDPFLSQSSAASHRPPLPVRRYPTVAAQDAKTEILLDRTVTGVIEEHDDNSMREETDVDSTDGLTNL